MYVVRCTPFIQRLYHTIGPDPQKAASFQNCHTVRPDPIFPYFDSIWRRHEKPSPRFHIHSKRTSVAIALAGTTDYRYSLTIARQQDCKSRQIRLF